ncbi:MAG TPA: hypothetical protein VGB19_09680 [Actinomycetota bacterium]
MSAQPAVDIADIRDDPREVDILADRLNPAFTRAAVLARFDEIFRSGTAPSPLPQGFQPGRLLATSIQPSLDGAIRRIAKLWMPWKGKVFDPDTMTGVNRFQPNVRLPMKAVWPGYTPETQTVRSVEAFPFRNRVAPGKADPDIEVFKIDYDFEANPSFLIRRILDELVQIAPGRYLGKILFRVGDRFHPIGFFSLRSSSE